MAWYRQLPSPFTECFLKFKSWRTLLKGNELCFVIEVTSISFVFIMEVGGFVTEVGWMVFVTKAGGLDFVTELDWMVFVTEVGGLLLFVTEIDWTTEAGRLVFVTEFGWTVFVMEDGSTIFDMEAGEMHAVFVGSSPEGTVEVTWLYPSTFVSRTCNSLSSEIIIQGTTEGKNL